MTVNDPVYGTFRISSPVVLALIETPAFQRLKGIGQFGMPDRYYHIDGFSRYEHSIGVYRLLEMLDAPEEEQVAGLLHDVSHTAFSHLVDWVIGNQHKEDFQDQRHHSVLNEPGIADVLRAYGYDPDAIADYHRFGLLEKDAPDLCADRIDYVLRESEPWISQACLPYMRAHEGEIVFTEERSAALFARNFLRCQEGHWGGYESVTRYVLLADALRKALEDGTVTMDDFLGTDEEIIAKLLASENPFYRTTLETLEQRTLDHLPRTGENLSKKFRYVDPKILRDGTTTRLSAIDATFAEELEKAREANDNGFAPGMIPA